MPTVRERLQRRRGRGDPTWIRLGIGPSTPRVEARPDKTYYYRIRQNYRRSDRGFAGLESYVGDLFDVARVSLAHDGWLFRRRHLSALLWAYRQALADFRACPFPHSLWAVVRQVPFESHNLFLGTATAGDEDARHGAPVRLSFLPPLFAPRLSLEQHEIVRWKDHDGGDCFRIRRR